MRKNPRFIVIASQCSGSSQHVMRSASSPIIAESTTTSSSAVTSSLPGNIALPETPHSAYGRVSSELRLLRELPPVLRPSFHLAANLTTPRWRNI